MAQAEFGDSVLFDAWARGAVGELDHLAGPLSYEPRAISVCATCGATLVGTKDGCVFVVVHTPAKGSTGREWNTKIRLAPRKNGGASEGDQLDAKAIEDWRGAFGAKNGIRCIAGCVICPGAVAVVADDHAQLRVWSDGKWHGWKSPIEPAGRPLMMQLAPGKMPRRLLVLTSNRIIFIGEILARSGNIRALVQDETELFFRWLVPIQGHGRIENGSSWLGVSANGRLRTGVLAERGRSLELKWIAREADQLAETPICVAPIREVTDPRAYDGEMERSPTDTSAACAGVRSTRAPRRWSACCSPAIAYTMSEFSRFSVSSAPSSANAAAGSGARRKMSARRV